MGKKMGQEHRCLANCLQSGWKSSRRSVGTSALLQNVTVPKIGSVARFPCGGDTNHDYSRRVKSHNGGWNWLDAAIRSSAKEQRRWIYSRPPVHDVAMKKKIERTKQIVRYGSWQQWQRILDLFVQEKETYELVELSTTLSQLVKIKSFKGDHPLIGEILDKIANCIQKSSLMETRHYSNICHSIAKLNTRHDSVHRIVNYLSSSDFAKEFLDRAKAQDISNLFWSLARLHRPDLLKFLLGQMNGKCQNDLFNNDNPQHIANIAWACATLGYSWPALFTTINERSHWLVTKGIPQAIANTAWACATLDYAAPALFAAIENRSQSFVANCTTPKGIATVAWACATLKHSSPVLFAAIDKRSEWLVAKSYYPQAVATTAWACAKLEHTSPTLFASIEKRYEWFVAKGTPQDIADTAWACAKLGHALPNLFAAIASRWDWLMATGTKQNVINTRWAFQTLEKQLQIIEQERKEV